MRKILYSNKTVKHPSKKKKKEEAKYQKLHVLFIIHRHFLTFSLTDVNNFSVYSIICCLFMDLKVIKRMIMQVMLVFLIFTTLFISAACGVFLVFSSQLVHIVGKKWYGKRIRLPVNEAISLFSYVCVFLCLHSFGEGEKKSR